MIKSILLAVYVITLTSTAFALRDPRTADRASTITHVAPAPVEQGFTFALPANSSAPRTSPTVIRASEVKITVGSHRAMMTNHVVRCSARELIQGSGFVTECN